MRVYQESNSVSEKVVPIPITDEIFDYLFIGLLDLIIKKLIGFSQTNYRNGEKITSKFKDFLK
jgi:hypothetical protein